LQNQTDNYFLTLPEPSQSALLYLRQFFMNEMGLTEAWKFNTPFYYYKNKWFCYLIYIKKKDETYISFVLGNKIEFPNLVSEGRKKMKIYKINPNENINTLELKEIVSLLKNFY
jgi:hypothetical protein